MPITLAAGKDRVTKLLRLVADVPVTIAPQRPILRIDALGNGEAQLRVLSEEPFRILGMKCDTSGIVGSWEKSESSTEHLVQLHAESAEAGRASVIGLRFTLDHSRVRGVSAKVLALPK